EHLLDQLGVVAVLRLVVVVVILPDVADVFQKQHRQDVVLVDARVHRSAEGVAGGPYGGVDGVLADWGRGHGEVVHGRPSVLARAHAPDKASASAWSCCSRL